MNARVMHRLSAGKTESETRVQILASCVAFPLSQLPFNKGINQYIPPVPMD